MTLTRRYPKPSSVVAPLVGHTSAALAVLSGSDDDYYLSDWCPSRWYDPSREKRHRPRRQYRVCFSYSFLILTTSITYALFWASPGMNYFQRSFWRWSNRISVEQQRSLRSQFPVHIDPNNPQDTEEITHPGYLLADRNRLQALLADEEGITILQNPNMTVPKFWDPDIFGEFGGVRTFLGNQGQYLITPEEASAVGSWYAGKETIFVALASYRDPECYNTVESIFARAKFPERIRVAIVDQRRLLSESTDSKNGSSDPTCRPPTLESCRDDPSQALCNYKDNIDWIEYPAQLMTGPILARHLAYRMYRGEYFALQIDSHVRFVANWDEDIISQWVSTGNEMAVISTYMNDITNSIDPDTHESLRSSRAMMCSLEYEWKGDPKEHIRFKIQPTNKPKIPDSPMLHPFFAAGFSFARGHFVVQVPYDQYLPFVFQGEEILQSIRGFTYGYDFYAPLRSVAFHIYAMKDNIEKRSNLHTFDENEFLFPGVKKQSYQRLAGIAGTSLPVNDYFDLEEESYGLGQTRPRKQFFDTFGIDPEAHTVKKGLCSFVQGTFGVKKSMHSIFRPFLRYDKMGIDYSRVEYKHVNPIHTDTPIDSQELAYLREKLRQQMN